MPAKSSKLASIAKPPEYFPRQNYIKAIKYANFCRVRGPVSELRNQGAAGSQHYGTKEQQNRSITEPRRSRIEGFWHKIKLHLFGVLRIFKKL